MRTPMRILWHFTLALGTSVIPHRQKPEKPVGHPHYNSTVLN
jgi:hypothetical protein